MQSQKENLVTQRLMLLQSLYSLDKNIKNMRPIVDTNSPNDYSHIHDPNAGKKYHLKRMKYQMIEYENRQLMGKMYKILTRKPEMPQPRVKSLNSEKRKREQRRISEENRILSKQLTGAQPSIKRKQLETHAYKNELYKRNISTFCDGMPKKPMFHPPMTPGVRSLYSTKSPSYFSSRKGIRSNAASGLPRLSQERGSIEMSQEINISTITGVEAVEEDERD